MPSQIDLPADDLFAAARRPEVVAAMEAFYVEADRRIAALPATCWNKGECCRFGRYGHRLYVTALEVVYYLARVEAEAQRPSAPAAGGGRPAVRSLPIVEDSCPHAHDGRCHARANRPLGCRIFYCDPAAQHWQGPLTEELLARLRSMHDELDVPYFYADWMQVLRALQT